MKLETAKMLLNSARRDELRDHAFGDMEVYWIFGGEEIATGYFSGTTQSVTVQAHNGEHFTFEGDAAIELHSCGTLGRIDRNDETEPGLTTEGVLRELTQTEQ